MKPLIPAALLIALSTVALAKPTPIELPTALVDAAVMNLGSGGSVQENGTWMKPSLPRFSAEQAGS